MPATAQVIGHGSQFELDTTPSGTGIVGDTWLAIAGVVSVDLGSNKVDTHDNTDMGTTGTARTFVGGLENPGDWSLKLNLKPGDTTQAALRTAKDGAVHWFKAISPGAAFTVLTAGIITSMDLAIPDDKLPTLTVKIQLSGTPTYTNC